MATTRHEKTEIGTGNFFITFEDDDEVWQCGLSTWLVKPNKEYLLVASLAGRYRVLEKCPEEEEWYHITTGQFEEMPIRIFCDALFYMRPDYYMSSRNKNGDNTNRSIKQ